MGLPEATGNYPSTFWTEVAEAGQVDRTAAMQAFGRVVAKYRAPLLIHLIRRFNLPIEAAEDLLQDFMRAKMVEQNLLGKACPERGRFRTFLMSALDKFVVSEFRKQYAQKRRPTGGFCSLEELPESAAMRLAQDFDENWAREVLNRTINLMREECSANGNTDLWGIFEGRLLRPTLEGVAPVQCKELAARYNLKTEAQVSKRCDAAIKLYKQLLHGVVAEYAGGPEAVKQELKHLRLGLLK
jgi:RNA polymerase sigma-70 factor (ECF subfamily)